MDVGYAHRWLRQCFPQRHSLGLHSTCVSLLIQFDRSPHASSGSSFPTPPNQLLHNCPIFSGHAPSSKLQSHCDPSSSSCDSPSFFD